MAVAEILDADAHVVEPPNVWTDRLPSKYKDVGPRIVRAPVGDITFIGGKFTPTVGNPGDGPGIAQLRFQAADDSGMPVAVPDLLATICLALGIDIAKQNNSNVGRPIRLVEPSAKPIKEVLA